MGGATDACCTYTPTTQKQMGTLTGKPSLEMVRFLGIRQVISLSRTLAPQSTPPTVIEIFMQEFTKFSFWCCVRYRD